MSPSSFNENGSVPQMSLTVGGDDVSFTVTAAASAAVALSRALASGASSSSSYCHLTPYVEKDLYTILNSCLSVRRGPINNVFTLLL